MSACPCCALLHTGQRFGLHNKDKIDVQYYMSANVLVSQLLFAIHTFSFFSQPLPPRLSTPAATVAVAPHAAAVRFSLRFVCFVSSLTAGRTPPTHPYRCRASHRHRHRPAIVAPHAATIAIHSAVVSLSLRFVCL
ncbi:hypothetical protein RIF29_41785 [Crotalaria pallida]|uniref:Uncharacterized protein n=1 Tax=Crotalaria pallida TaxID=3830 RepID=A0AAN9HRV5_CROPI